MEKFIKQSSYSQEQIESHVKKADMNDRKNVEDLRYYFHNLMYKQGWMIKDLIDAFNKQNETLNQSAVHQNTIKQALSGKKQFRHIAYQVEQFLLNNQGPCYSETNLISESAWIKHSF